MRVLVVNVGSSSVKLRVLDGPDDVVVADDLAAADPAAAVERRLSESRDVDAVGHRIVHGGPHLTRAALVDRRVIGELREASELAPVHNPPALAALEAALDAAPELPNVACFDTAFHAGMPAEASLYAIPSDWTERHRIRRYGFHGLSVAYSTRQAGQLLGLPPEEMRIVVCHLGAGASVTAVRGGRSVDTTMGFTPLEGLVMARRSGSVDPGLLLWLERSRGVSSSELEDVLEHRSGIAGMAGGDGDMRAVVQAAARGETRAATALGVYIHRLRAAIAAMAAAMGGLDAIVFTGGVGEGSDHVRTTACAGLGFLGIEIESTGREDPPDEDLELTGGRARVRALVVRAREDLQIAAETRDALTRGQATPPIGR
ncbi:MAG: acetate/propionate family kinase [Actinobacteria bacterium]|nr:acetate/propionate family kinase [Actinomycetota bacterium]